MVKEEWRGLGDMSILDKFKVMKGPNKRWNKVEFGSIDEKKNTLESKLALIDRAIEDGIVDEAYEARRKALLSFLERWYDIKDCYWKQMSRSKLANHMDRNTRYFHAIAGAKHRRKVILSLSINEDVVCPRRIKIKLEDFISNCISRRIFQMFISKKD